MIGKSSSNKNSWQHNVKHSAGGGSNSGTYGNAAGNPTPKASFQTPESIAAEEEKHPETATVGQGNRLGAFTARLKKRFSKKQWIVIGCAFVVVAGAGVGTAIALSHHQKAPVKIVAKQKPKVPAAVAPLPTTVASTLDGLQVDPSVNQRPVTAVMIENSLDARPQSGLNQAGVVFEAIAEGGITRFMALYQDQTPSYIGPVRSVRPYYLEWLLGFDAAVAHVGGSPEAIADIAAWHVKNLDQEYNGSYYQRITSRVAPHNAYTSMANLNALEAKLGYGAANYTGFARKADAPSKTPTATSIDFDISSYDYNPHYDYDAATNSYLRSEAGKPHLVVDQNGAEAQIAPKVVIALIMPVGLESDGLHMQYGTIGSGTMYVFQDGTVEQGTWAKASNASQFVFKDTSGNIIKLNAGQTWITALGSTSDVSYK